MEDDQIAIKMLIRFKQIKKDTSKKMVDIEMMLGLLDVVREYDIQPPNQEVAMDEKPCNPSHNTMLESTYIRLYPNKV